VRITGEDGKVQYNHATTAVGYACASDSRVRFGLGGSRVAREIEIVWSRVRGTQAAAYLEPAPTAANKPIET